MFKPVRTALVAAIAGAALWNGAQASAQPGTETRQVAFKFNPEAQAGDVYSDLKRTAQRACEEPGDRSMQSRRAARACANELLDKAVARIARRELSDLHFKKTGRRMFADMGRKAG